MTNTEYRKDIDGIRAIAILLVLIFHAFPKALAGGFVGVDVFFVISGYLISKNIIQDLKLGQFSILNFYSRRIKRIFPALSVALLLTLVIGWYILFSNEFQNLAKHVLAAASFTSNLVLWKESGYFDVSSELKPLLHLWSLGIEEQFYLVWPLLLGLCAHRKKFLYYVITLTILISFFLNIYFIETLPSLVFFNPIMRFWELAFGALLAFIEIEHPQRLQSLKEKGKLANIISILGLLSILLAAAILNENHSFPGFAALAPVLGCFMIIAAGPDSLANRFLSHRFFVAIGLISYPLYLFHWPLISYSYILYHRNPPVHVTLFLVFISIALAWLTYTCIEKPIKTKMKKLYSSAQLNAAFVAGLLLVTGMGLIIFLKDGFPYRLEATENLAKSKKEFRDSIQGNQSKACQEKFFKIEICAVSNLKQDATVALIGDSHANQFYPPLEKYFKEKNENLILLAKSGVPPLFDVTIVREGENSLENVLNWVLHNPKIHTVILSAFWSSYFNEKGTTTGLKKYKGELRSSEKINQTNQEEIFKSAFSKTLKMLIEKKKKIIFFYDILAVPMVIDSCMNRRSQVFTSSDTCSFNQEKPVAEQLGYRYAVEPILRTYSEIQVFDPLLFNCENMICYVVKDGQFLYSDEHHLSIDGSLLLLKKFTF